MRRVFLMTILLVLTVAVKAQFKEGTHYEVVNEKASETPTVTEYFSLYCGHCFQFETLINDFKKGLKEGTTFEKSHVSYIPRDNEAVSFGTVKAFLVMQKLGRESRLVPAYFDHVHRFRQEVKTEEDIKKVFLGNGVPAELFDKYYNDPELVEEAKEMAAIWEERKIDNVPTMVVNDKYKVNMQSVNNLNDLIKLVNFLLSKEESQ